LSSFFGNKYLTLAARFGFIGVTKCLPKATMDNLGQVAILFPMGDLPV
jgi:hypothetical protein